MCCHKGKHGVFLLQYDPHQLQLYLIHFFKEVIKPQNLLQFTDTTVHEYGLINNVKQNRTFS